MQLFQWKWYQNYRKINKNKWFFLLYLEIVIVGNVIPASYRDTLYTHSCMSSERKLWKVGFLVFAKEKNWSLLVFLILLLNWLHMLYYYVGFYIDGCSFSFFLQSIHEVQMIWQYFPSHNCNISPNITIVCVCRNCYILFNLLFPIFFYKVYA